MTCVYTVLLVRSPRLGRILEKGGFAAVDLGGFVSSSGNISTYQEVLIKKICLQFL
ncbi:hypothetical protein [Nostoc sp. CHAB 5715]|uniref:hypothetical protein n=1 Tax=Nostoc sp. CHAB 5715 TaxID=2780400 RepID=UPI001E44102F|nr:hypothetical protein [Nostoc sp. CHAB 5715]MCC5623302.1 hypothetical protein [Nostoc sp. CHAB 5715]